MTTEQAPPGARITARKKRQRGNVVAALAITLAAGALAAVVTVFLLISRDLDEANRARDLLSGQVQSLGGTPIAGPPGSRGDTGVVGPSGPPGAPGRPGKDAPAITPSPGPTGPVGPSGAPGADSTVPGPQGSTGPVGASGKDGVNGADGADGTNGSDGKDGAPPAEWTYVDQDGNEGRCVRADDFDPDNPRYKCTPTSAATPSPTQTSSSPPPDPKPEPTPSDSPTSSSLVPLGLPERRRS